MRFGTYYFLQRTPGLSEAEVIRTELDQMVWSEELGFDSVWLTEHHFADYGLSSAPNVLGSALLSRTQRIHLGLAVFVLPFHDPIRFAEEMATLDIISGGRFTVGIGRGNRAAEFAGYRIPQQDSRSRIQEAVEVVVKAWTQDKVEHEGEHWRIPGISVYPKPITKPHPPIAVAVSSAESIAWTAHQGYRMLNSGLNTPMARNLESLALYRSELDAAGHDDETKARLLSQWTVTKHVYVAPTDAEAEAEARGPEEWYRDAFCRSLRADHLPGLHPSVYAQAQSMIENASKHTWEWLLQECLIVGSPETVREKVKGLEKSGVGELACWMSFGGLPEDRVRRSMKLFADEVIPAFR